MARVKQQPNYLVWDHHLEVGRKQVKDDVSPQNGVGARLQERLTSSTSCPIHPNYARNGRQDMDLPVAIFADGSTELQEAWRSVADNKPTGSILTLDCPT